MAAFIHKKMNQGAKVIKTAEELAAHRSKNISAIIVLPEENSNDMKNILNLINQFEDIEIAVLLDKSLLDLKLQSKKSLVLFRKFDDGDKILNLGDGEINFEPTKQFIIGLKFPLV
jgi:hypothetical protein